ncbi:hypothetical protein HJC23_006995 [Cyclotella cryptica]|uniref:Uncharacterized protein n=1 Tax=Cyclotella cryptica TaxID=29204 RepID=A0ABD3QLX9_9STRA
MRCRIPATDTAMTSIQCVLLAPREEDEDMLERGRRRIVSLIQYPSSVSMPPMGDGERHVLENRT